MSLATYKKRGGTLDRGKDYEWLLCAYYSLTLTTSTDIADFELFTNNDFFGDFDDVVLRIQFCDGTVKIFLLQLKHSEKAKTLTLNSLESSSGDFALLKYKKSYDNILSLENFVFILYTNRTGNYKDNTKIIFDGREIFIERDNCLRNNLLNTGRKGSIFKFKDDSRQKWDFFSNFYLYVGQQNDTKLKESIANLLKATLRCDIYNTFIEFMRGWWAGNFKLTKYDVVAKLGELVFSPMIRTLSSEESNDKTKLIKEAILEFDLTLVEASEKKKITKIWKDALEPKDIKRVSLTALKYGLITRGIGKIDELSDEKKSKVLWFMDQVPLIIEIDHTKREEIAATICFLERHKQKKKIILLGKKLRKRLTQWNVFENLSDISIALREIITKTFTCSLQGKEAITLEELGENDIQIISAFRVNQLLEIATDTAFNIAETLEILPPIYIKRSFYKILLNYTAIDDLKESKILLSCNDQKEAAEKKFKKRTVSICHNDRRENFCKHHVFLAENEFLGKDLCQEFSTVIPTHHFRVISGQNLQWLSSNKNVELLQAHKRTNREHVFGENEIDSNFQNKIRVLTSHTGTGKTSFFNRIKNQSPPNHFVIKMDLRDHSEFFKSEKPSVWDYIMEYTRKSRNYNDFEYELLKSFPKNRMVLLWDGLDDLHEDSRDIFIESVGGVAKMGLTQWISAQNRLQKFLEDKVGVFSMNLVPFSEAEQLSYIQNRCGVTDHALMKNFFENIKILDNQEYLGVPLQLYILTDIFSKDPNLLKTIYSLTDMFAAFFEGKYNNFIVNETSQDLKTFGNLIEDAKSHRLEQYKIAAVQTHLPRLYRRLQLKSAPKFLEDVKRGDFLGLIERSSEEGFVFEYQILGEYFSALFLAEFLPEGLDQFIFEEKSRNIRFMFDLLLARNEPTFLAILYKKFDEIGSIRVKDRKGRNPLHVICSYGNRHPSLLWRQSIDEDSDVVKVTIKNLCKLYDPSEVDDLFGWTCFDYADCSYSLGLIEIIESNHHKECLLKLRRYKLGVVLYYSLKMNYVTIFKSVTDYPYVVDSNGDNLIHVAAEFDREDSLKKLLSHEIHLKSINKHNGDRWSPLHFATFNGNLNLIKFLLDKGATFRLTQPSPMSLAAAKGRRDIIEFFLARGCSPNEFYHTNHFTTTIFQAIHQKKNDIVDLLLKHGAKLLCVNTESSRGDAKPNPYGLNLFHMLLENEQFEEAEVVLKRGIGVDSVDYHGRTAFHHAASNNQASVVVYLLAKGANHLALDKCGKTPLHCAAMNGSEEVAKILIGLGAEIDRQDNDGETPLHLAVHSGEVSFATFLLQEGVDPNICNKYKRTPLHIVARYNLNQFVDTLNQYGANLEARDGLYGRTPLHLAAWFGNEDCVKILLEKKTDFDCRDNFGYTPLHLAVEANGKESCQLLLKAGASISSINRNGDTPLRLLNTRNLALTRLMLNYDPEPIHSAVLRHDSDFINELMVLGYDINATDSNGSTGLHLAVDSKMARKMVEVLIKLGIDVRKQNRYGYTALHYTLQSELPRENVVDLLLVADEENITVNSASVKGITPLHLAVQGSSSRYATLLLKKGANVETADDDGLIPLHYAACSGNFEIVTLLVEEGCEINKATKRGRTALHMAATGGHSKIVEFLLTRKASVEAKDFYGDTPLDDALNSERPEVFKLLLKQAPNFDLRKINRKNRSLLHMAAKQGLLELVEFFSNHIAVGEEDSEGTTPLEDALYNRHYDVFEFLLNRSTSRFDVNKFSRRYRRYPLHVVASTGSLDLVNLFLTLFGATVEVVDDDGNTPLHSAVDYDHIDVFLVLLEYSREAFNMRNKQGQAVLHTAATLKRDQFTEALIKKGANVDIVDGNNRTAFDLLFDKGHFHLELLKRMKNFDLNKPRTINKITVLHATVHLKLDTIIAWLCDNGASINVKDNDGNTPLHYAAESDIKILRLLLEKYKDTINTEERNSDGETILHLAASHSFENVEEILKRGASPFATTKFGATPLHYALKQPKTFKFLWNVARQADIFEISGHNTRTVLHEAASDDDLDSVKFFLEIGLKINAVDNEGHTPLWDAACGGHWEVLKAMLGKDKDRTVVNMCYGGGRTLLHLAARGGNLDFVRLLVENGARKDIYDEQGCTAADVALRNDNQAVYEFLKS